MSPPIGTPKLGRHLGSTTNVVLIGQFYKWLINTCMKAILTLIV
jgi:hypothetical protein